MGPVAGMYTSFGSALKLRACRLSVSGDVTPSWWTGEGADDTLFTGAVDAGRLGPGGEPSFRDEILSSAASMMDSSLFGHLSVR